MIWNNVNEIDIPFVHDAVLLCALAGMQLRSVYMDPNGELAIRFNDKLSEKNIAFVLMQLNPYPNAETSINDIHPVNMIDYAIQNDHQTGYSTEIYSLEGIDYRNL